MRPIDLDALASRVDDLLTRAEMFDRRDDVAPRDQREMESRRHERVLAAGYRSEAAALVGLAQLRERAWMDRVASNVTGAAMVELYEREGEPLGMDRYDFAVIAWGLQGAKLREEIEYAQTALREIRAEAIAHRALGDGAPDGFHEFVVRRVEQELGE